jgi:hypothetical protein
LVKHGRHADAEGREDAIGTIVLVLREICLEALIRVEQSPVDLHRKLPAKMGQDLPQHYPHNIDFVGKALASEKLQGFVVTSLGQRKTSANFFAAVGVMHHPLQVLSVTCFP